MDLIRESIRFLLDAARLELWPECARLIGTVSGHPPAHWHLAEAACLAVGGASGQAVPVTAAMAALHTAIVVVDDLLDGDGRFVEYGSPGDLANLALAFAAAGPLAILHSSISLENQVAILACLNEALVSTGLGQDWDAHTAGGDEPEYWRVARQKSAPFFAAAFFSGALAGGTTLQTAQTLFEIGTIYGEMIQVHDDLRDALSVPACPDWTARRPTLPILFALSVDHPEREDFARLRAEVGDPEALRQAQAILLRCGAVSYCAHHLLRCRDRAVELLARAGLPFPDPLADRFTRAIAPVTRLFERSGASLPV